MISYTLWNKMKAETAAKLTKIGIENDPDRTAFVLAVVEAAAKIGYSMYQFSLYLDKKTVETLSELGYEIIEGPEGEAFTTVKWAWLFTKNFLP